jgi:hypothetical protein
MVIDREHEEAITRRTHLIDTGKSLYFEPKEIKGDTKYEEAEGT